MIRDLYSKGETDQCPDEDFNQIITEGYESGWTSIDSSEMHLCFGEYVFYRSYPNLPHHKGDLGCWGDELEQVLDGMLKLNSRIQNRVLMDSCNDARGSIYRKAKMIGASEKLSDALLNISLEKCVRGYVKIAYKFQMDEDIDLHSECDKAIQTFPLRELPIFTELLPQGFFGLAYGVGHPAKKSAQILCNLRIIDNKKLPRQCCCSNK